MPDQPMGAMSPGYQPQPPGFDYPMARQPQPGPVPPPPAPDYQSLLNGMAPAARAAVERQMAQVHAMGGNPLSVLDAIITPHIRYRTQFPQTAAGVRG
jgi:hypothetical protein